MRGDQRFRRLKAGLLCVALAALGLAPAEADAHGARCGLNAARGDHRDLPCRWEATWARSQAPNPAATAATDQSLRVIERVRASAVVLRVRLQNSFGGSQLVDGNGSITVGAATVARRTRGASVKAASIRRLRFAGKRSVTVAPGAYVTSDPVRLPVAAGRDVAVTLFLPGTQVPAGHPLDFVTQYSTPDGAGNHTRDGSGAAFSTTTRSTFIASAIEALVAPRAPGAVVAVGGSVVDGVGSTLDGYDSLPDQLAARVASELPRGKRPPVLNGGIASTTAATACASRVFGPGVEQRLRRDALSLANVSRLLVWAGTNDLANGCTGDQIIAAMTDIAAQARAAGAQVLISTITPRASYDAQQNAYRAQVNAWIRARRACSGVCDHALDFDSVLRDPTEPNRILPGFDSGDGVHPNPAGYRRLAAAVKLPYLVGRVRRSRQPGARDAVHP